jgi:hypothetical protein
MLHSIYLIILQKKKVLKEKYFFDFGKFFVCKTGVKIRIQDRKIYERLCDFEKWTTNNNFFRDAKRNELQTQ